MKPLLRTASTIFFGLLVVVSLLLLVAHTRPIRSRVLLWAVRWFATDAGIDARIGRLDYNLFTGRVSVEHVTLAASPGDGPPFFEADAVRLRLPWSALIGPLALDELALDRPRITIEKRSDASLNLPESRTPNGGLSRLVLDTVAVHDLSITYADRSGQLNIAARNVSFSLAPRSAGVIEGALSGGAIASLRAGERSTSTTQLAGRLAFDGANLAMNDVVVAVPEGRLDASGRIDRVLDRPSLDVIFTTRAELEPLMPWLGLDARARGRFGVTGRVHGPIASPTATVSASSDSMSWERLQDVAVRAEGDVAVDAVMLRAASAVLAGGEIAGRGRMELTPGGHREAHFEWKHLQTEPLISVAPYDMPFHVAARMDGRLDARWTKAQDADLTLENDSHALPAGPASVPVDGSLKLVVSRGRWQAEHDHRVGRSLTVAGKVGGRLGSELAGTTIAGDVRLISDNLSGLAHDLARTRLASSEMLRSIALNGEGRASLRIGGTIGAPQVDGAVSGARLVAYGIGPASLDGKVLADREHVRIAELQLKSGVNALVLNASERFDGQRLDGRFTATLPAVEQMLPALPSSQRPGGAVAIEATLGGTLERPRIDGSLSGRHLEIAGQVISSLTTGFRVERGVAFLDRTQLVQEPTGALSVEARYTLADGRYSIRARGEQMQVRPVPAGLAGPDIVPVTGRLTLSFEGSGSLKEPAGRGHLAFSSLEWDHRELAPVEADVVIDGGVARFTSVAPRLALTMSARAELREPRRFDADARFADVDLAKLAEISIVGAPTVQGRATFTTRAAGTLGDIAGASVDLDLQSFAARVEDQSLELAGPARLRYAGHEVSAENVHIRAGRATVTVAGRLSRAGIGGLHAALAGPIEDLGPLLRITGAPRDLVLRGSVDARIDVVGSFNQPSVDGQISLQTGSVQWPGVASASDVTLQSVYQGGVLHVRDLRGVWQGASVAAAGEFPARLFDRVLPAAYLKNLPAAPAHGEFRARIEGLTPAALEPFMSADTLSQVTGRAAVALEGQIDGLALERIRGTATIEQANLSIARVPLAQETPTTIALADRRLVIPPWIWGGAGSRMSIGGVVSLSDPSPQVELGVGGTLDLRLLNAFLSDTTTSGMAHVTLRAHGALIRPSFEGNIDIADGALRIRDPRIAVAELAGSLHLASDRITVKKLQGSVNGGNLVIAGGIGLDGYRPAAGRFTFAVREAPLDFPKGVRSQIDADLVFVLENNRPPELSGRVSVLRGLYRERLSLTRQFLEAGAIETVIESDEASLFGSTRLNVTIATNDDVRVDNNYGRMELGADLRLVGTIAQPGLQGRATIREGGRVFFGGNTYEVERGAVDFIDRTRIEPNLNIAARTRVSGYDVTLNLSGAPGAIVVNLTSDPPLGQDDLVSLLLTGRTLDQPGSVQTAVARDQLLGLLSGELLGTAGRAVGLDTLRLERGLADEDLVRTDPALIAGETDPSARLTVAKSIRRNMEFILSRDLRESGGITVIASYRPRRAIELRAISRDNTDRSYEFRQDLSFGGTGAAQRRPSRETRQISTVRAVLLTGTPGFPEQELRARLKLTAGDRFDFFRWQSDQDRLLDFYHDRGYLEARIAARRHDVAAADSGIELEYDIEQGPRTELAVEGYRLPDDVISRMRQEWPLAVFDEFLLDELRRLARERLVEDGFPQATISAVVRSTGPDEKDVVITIAPGPRADALRLRFLGNDAVDSLALEAFVREQRLERAGWIDPAALERALADYYRAHSRLAAAIKVGVPAFEGSASILPVTIDEGPAFRWSEITLEGVGADRIASVQQALDLRVGDAYRSGTLPVIRRAIESQYRREGFNAARVALGVAVHRESATVALTVNVEEGRRQVLQAIETNGAVRTNERFLAEALHLDVGSAVDLTELSAARKRLYDTGVFRRADIEIEPLAPDAASSPPNGGDESVLAHVTVEEVPPFRLRYGLQVNDELAPAADQREFGPGLTADLQRRNLWGRAMTAGLAFRYDRDHTIGRTFLTAPRFFGRPLTSTLFLSRSREDFAQERFLSFISDKTAVTAEQRIRPRTHLEMAYAYRFERNRTFDPNRDPNNPLGLDVTVHVARLTATTTFDSRDDPFDATRGWFHGSSFEYAPEVLGSDLRFAKYLLQQYYYHPLLGRLVLASAARLGLGRGYGQDLIPSEKYFAGGGNSVRGYREDSIGGRDFLGDPIGGNALLVFNEEARFPIYGRLRGVGFLDAGNVYPSISELSLSDLKVGVGLGFRINTPFALLRVDFGVPLSREPGDRRVRWFFSFGQMF